MKKYLIYKITNQVNEKIYIGLTSKQTVELRMIAHQKITKSNSKKAKKYYIPLQKSN